MLSLSIVFFIFIFSLNPQKVLSAENQSSKILEKISKDFTNKFCNSIAFGLSKESAMDFSLKENKQIFSKRKGFDQINKELMAENIATSVIYTCGYNINLSGDEGINIFVKDYLKKFNES